MDKLQAFYKSKEWETFRRVIISERTDDQGFVRCAICGKPILNKYDLVVHHKEELNEANVVDALVALNPDNVECVHFACHNKLHDRWQGGNGGYKPKPKRVFVVYGSPCSGKSSWVNQVKTDNDLVVDLDSIWQAVTGSDRYSKPDRLRGVVFGVRDCLYDMIKHRSGKWQDAYIVTGGARAGDRERLGALVGATDWVFVDTDKQECFKRLELREMDDENREKWVGFIEKWFDEYQE